MYYCSKLLCSHQRCQHTACWFTAYPSCLRHLSTLFFTVTPHHGRLFVVYRTVRRAPPVDSAIVIRPRTASFPSPVPQGPSIWSMQARRRQPFLQERTPAYSSSGAENRRISTE